MCCIFGRNKGIVTQIFSFNSKRMLYGLKSVPDAEVKLEKVKNFRPKNYTIFKYFILLEITNKMQPCIRICYSTVHWRLNMFRAAYRTSWKALTVLAASGLHTHAVTGRSQVWLGLDYGRSPHAYVNQRLQIQLELLMMSYMPLETCWASNERWNNKF